MAPSNWLSGVNVVLVMAYGSLGQITSGELFNAPAWVLSPLQVFVLLFIFVKRQIMRFAMKSRRGPHVPVGHNAPKELKEEIDIRLSKVQGIKFEPRLLAEEDARMLELEKPEQDGSCNYLYRMKTLDAVKDSDIPFYDNGKKPGTLLSKNFRAYLLELRDASSPYKGVRKILLESLLDGYDAARYGTGVHGKTEHQKFMEYLNELSSIVKSQKGGSQGRCIAAAKDLTASPEPTETPTIQVTYLPSNQKSKRPKHFLELKSFKDNYNTLESTL